MATKKEWKTNCKYWMAIASQREKDLAHLRGEMAIAYDRVKQVDAAADADYRCHQRVLEEYQTMKGEHAKKVSECEKLKNGAAVKEAREAEARAVTEMTRANAEWKRSQKNAVDRAKEANQLRQQLRDLEKRLEVVQELKGTIARIFGEDE
jgi:hypothetical protein